MSSALFRSLRLQGYYPRSLLDIGANVGEFTRNFLEQFPTCVPTLIEPNMHCIKQLELLDFEVIPAAASDKDGIAEIYLTNEWLESTGASLYRENTQFFRDEVVVVKTVPTIRLDRALAGRSFDFVKIDVQGGELDVLNGGAEVIRKADYILIEVPIVEYNLGAPPAEKLFEKLSSMGFRCIDAVHFHRLGSIQNGNLLQIDFLFERLRPRASQNYHYGQSASVATTMIDFVRGQKKICPDFSVLSIGAIVEPWESNLADATFNNRPQGATPLQFTGNMNRPEDWRPLLDHVAKHGKFAYALCTHALESLAAPSVVMEMMPRIADAGYICVASKYHELLRHEGPYRGNIDHRWIFCVRNGGLVLVPKISLIDHMPFDEEGWQENPDCWELHIHWRGNLQFSILNNDYLGPNAEEVVIQYAHILASPDK